MAFEIIKRYEFYNFEQEEIIETQQIAGADGVVTEQSTLIQPYASIKGELVIYQNRDVANNKSDILAELWVHAEAGENGEGFTLTPVVSSKPYYYTIESNLMLDYIYLNESHQPYVEESHSVEPGESISIKIRKFQSNLAGNLTRSSTAGSSTVTQIQTCHDLDGEFVNMLYGYKNDSKYRIADNVFDGDFYVEISKLLQNGENTSFDIIQEFEYDFTDDMLPIDRAIYLNTASNFTDEENATLTYTVTTGFNYIIDTDGEHYGATDRVSGLQAAISFDGETADIAYRDIPIDGNSYTFVFTDAEREILRQKAQDSNSVPIYYLIKTTREVGSKYVPYESRLFSSSTERILTVIGCEPTLNPTVRDISPETLLLTGNPNIFVRYESMVEFSTGAVASKHATIVSQSVQCGSKVIYNLYNGVIDDIESGSFIFNATDSRGLHADQVVITNTAMIEYIKPTCKQEVEIAFSGETGATVNLKVSGVCFNGSFGALDNILVLQVRYKVGSGEFGAWQTINGTPTFDGNTYELTTTFTGLEYNEAYTFQCRATDMLNLAETSQYTARLLPVFDWSETDFNFNVPVNIDADEINMHGETIIRHNATANNTVLSATGGHIYIRPGGTNDTSGETIIYPDGSIEFGGIVDLSKGFEINGAPLADYVIEQGETSMGSNGTWYWRKWASGKSEAYGCRNFGNMAITTAWGNLYRSAVLTQDLPDDVFVRTPDSININIVHSNFGGWICKHEQTAPSAITTGSFIFVRPASATASPTNIGFYVAGEWK